MKNLNCLFLILFFFNKIDAQDDKNNNYYWYNGQKQYLLSNSNLKYYLLKESFDFNKLKQIDENYQIINYGLDDAIMTLNSLEKPINNELKKWVLIKSDNNLTIKIFDEYKVIENFGYKGKDNKDIGLSHLFYVKLKNQDDFKLLEQKCEEYNVSIVGRNIFMPRWYTLSSENSNLNTLKL